MKKFLAAAAATVVLGWAGTASAALITVNATIQNWDGNDCAGALGGKGGTICDVGFPLNTTVSPIVAKYDLPGKNSSGGWETYSSFPSVDGSEFSGTFLTSNVGGSWSYAPSPNDPVIRYWVAKGGDDFNLFWVVDDAELVSNGGVCDPNAPYTLNCLQKALAVTSGSYTVPGTAGLSHISFYDTGGGGGGGGGGGSTPEPGSLLLLGGGLIAAAAALRRRQS